VRFKASRCEYWRTKKRDFGRELVPFGERFMGLGNTPKESLCGQLGRVLGNQKRRSLGNQRLKIGSLLGVRL